MYQASRLLSLFLQPLHCERGTSVEEVANMECLIHILDYTRDDGLSLDAFFLVSKPFTESTGSIAYINKQYVACHVIL